MTRYVVLRPVEPPRICFLREAILWRAFGIYPTGYWDDKGREIREKPEAPEYFTAPMPDDTGDQTYLSERQTNFAGLPPDPSMQAILAEEMHFELDHYDKMISLLTNSQDDLSMEIAALLDDRARASEYWARYSEWRQLHDAYVDQFQLELLLALRKGLIQAFGRRLPRVDRERTLRLFERLGTHTGDIEPTAISQALWVSNHVDWDECSLSSKADSYVWVHVLVEDTIKLFPPVSMLPTEKLLPLGDCYAIADALVSSLPKGHSGTRGRPSLPWEGFYVEVARMYRDGQMPQKKEAAIQHFQTWFEKELGIEASRSAVGQKLKPFFDKL
jgi:hypothetical protein